MKSRDGAGTPREGRAQNLVVQLLIVGLAAILLFWNLDWRYLWQDEAATAVLSARMLKFGRPLAYDGVNLITNDNFVAEDVATIDQRTGDPKAAVAYYIERGDLKPDTSWKYQPWGQFMVTAASLALFGKTTLAARLPFAIAALATVILFHGFVRQYFESWRMASLATLLVVLNVYWILHSRQCRYYSLSSLFLILTLITYARWQWGRARFALALFLVTAWCWFQVDYGTVWPVLGVLFLDACWAARWRQAWKPIGAGLILSAAIAPFAYYYELWGRFSVQIGTWADRFHHNLFNLDRFVVPAVALVASAILLIRQWTKLTDPERRLVAIGIGIIVALMFWVPTVAPETFVRYIMPAVSIGALLLAWVLFRLLGRHRPLYLWLAGAVVVFTPALSWPLRPIVPSPTRYYVVPDAVLRPEFGNFYYEIFTRQPDPNRIVIEWLKQNASPSDEILINYEDVPLMFYLPNPIRGGIAAFRTEDDAKTLPRFMIVRRSVIFVHWAVFARVAERHNWVEVSTKAPDDTWGNNPDPMWKVPGLRHVPLLMARRAD
jgi:hypothetical protein